MAKSSPEKLAFQKAYNAKPENVKKRELNNAARLAALKTGKATKGDGTEVDHKVPLNNGGTNDPKNLRVIDGSRNASWRKGDKGNYKVNKV